MSRIEWIGLPLSALALAVFGWMLLDWFRRRSSFPALQYGGSIMEPRMVAWLWLLVLVGSFVLSKGTVLSTTESDMPDITALVSPGEVGNPDARVLSARSWHVTLPFYKYERSTQQIAAGLEIASTTRALLFPLWLIIGLFAYWRVAMRGTITRTDADE